MDRENSSIDMKNRGTDRKTDKKERTAGGAVRKAGRLIWDFSRTAVLALVLAVAVTCFVKPVMVLGNSMSPTIRNHSYMLTSTVPYLMGEPEAGDIVVFNSHVYTETGKEKNFVKRVVGVPGDRISIHDGFVFRNGERLEEDYLAGTFTDGQMEETAVTEGHVFVLGDNRLPGGSMDSRDPGIGQVAMEDISGKVILRLYPFDEMGRI